MALSSATPVFPQGQPPIVPALDLTLYPADLSEPDFEALLNLYRSIAPPNRRTRWKLAEHVLYQPYDEAGRSKEVRSAGSGVRSLDAGLRTPDAGRLLSPEMARFRQRVAEGWRAEFHLWDGQPTDSWSFHCYRIPKTRESPPAAFYRFLIPTSADPTHLRRVAEAVAEGLPMLSGHGGYVLLYDGTRLAGSFDRIYPLARRYWGPDVEHLNSTIRLMRGGIKGISWLTLIGQDFLEKVGGRAPLEALADGETRVTVGRGGVLIVAGPVPDWLDQNRPGPEMSRYQRIARALERVFLPAFPDLPGRFAAEGNSAAWFRRFLNPNEWRR
jgi:hypothetical protein